jgi:protein-tyrosine-phosphatase
VESQDFLAAFLDLIEKNQVDTVMPMSDTALSAMILLQGDPRYGELGKRVRLCCPPPSVVEIVLQKEKTIALAESCGIPVPATFLIPDRERLEALRGSLRFPLVGKSRSRKVGDRGFKVRHFANFDQLALLFETDSDGAARCLFQEYFHGEGVGIEILISQRLPLIVFQHRRLKELSTGVSVLARAEKVDPQLERWALLLLKRAGWEGIAMVEFRQDRTSGRSVLMEINGRYWGSISLPIHAGVNFPLYEWKLARGENPVAVSGYRSGIRVRWLAGDMMRMLEFWQARKQHGATTLLREWGQFIWDFRPWVRHMVFAWSDPKQATVELFAVSKSIASYCIKALVSKVLPEPIMEGALAARRLDRQAGRTYLKIRLRRAIQPRRSELGKILAGAHAILFICHGNIIRSPMAAALLGRELTSRSRNSICIQSAGIKASPAARVDERAIQVGDELGISLHTHRPRAVNLEMVQRADVIFVMDSISEAMLLMRYPAASRKTFLMGEVVQHHSGMSAEIADPYQGSIEDVRKCFHRLVDVTQTLADRLP